MIESHKEAELLCEKFGVNPSEHPHLVVTANGNIYTTGKVDPKDTSDQFVFTGVEEQPEVEAADTETKTTKRGRKKQD